MPCWQVIYLLIYPFFWRQPIQFKTWANSLFFFHWILDASVYLYTLWNCIWNHFLFRTFRFNQFCWFGSFTAVQFVECHFGVSRSNGYRALSDTCNLVWRRAMLVCYGSPALLICQFDGLYQTRMTMSKGLSSFMRLIWNNNCLVPMTVAWDWHLGLLVLGPSFRTCIDLPSHCAH